MTDKKQNILWLLASLAVGLFFALVALAVLSLPFKWALYGFAAILFPFLLVMLPGDKKRYLLGLTLFFLPLSVNVNLFRHPSISGADSITLSVFDISLAVLIAVWIIDTAKSKQVGTIRFFPAISIPTIALIVAYGLSMLAARDLLASLFDVVVLVKAYILFFYVANTIKSQKDVTFVMKMLFLGVFVQTLIFLNQFVFHTNLAVIGVGEEWTWNVRYTGEAFSIVRVCGTLGHVNHYAKYITLLLPFSFVVMLASRNAWVRHTAALVSILSIITLILSVTRSSWISLVGAIPLVLYLLFIKNMLSLRVVRNVMLSAIGFAIILLFFGDVIYDRVTTDDKGSAYSRVETSRVAIEIIKDHPFIGVGVNNYGYYPRQYLVADDNYTRRAVVHNNYLLHFAETGVIGFMALLWFFLALYLRSRHALSSRIRLHRIIAIGMIASLVGVLIFSIGNNYKGSPALIWTIWILAGLVEAINRMDKVYVESGYTLLQNKEWLYGF